MICQLPIEKYLSRTLFLISHRYFLFLVQEEETYQILNFQNIEFEDNQK